MTNPNPSPELIKVLEQIAISSNCDWDQVRKHPAKQIDLIHTLAVDALYACPQTLPAPGEVDYAEMLQTAWESCPSGDGLGLPPIIFSDAEAAHIVKSLATVAAANDEGERSARMREAIDAGLRAFCSDTSDFTMSSAMRRAAADFIMGQPGMFPLATSRSQHEKY